MSSIRPLITTISMPLSSYTPSTTVGNPSPTWLSLLLASSGGGPFFKWLMLSGGMHHNVAQDGKPITFWRFVSVFWIQPNRGAQSFPLNLLFNSLFPFTKNWIQNLN